MSTQLLIYKTAVPVNPARHGQWSVELEENYGFSRNVNSVPLMAVEFARAATQYPIVFAGSEDSFLPAAILGMRGNENLFLTEQGSWNSKYVPAFLRRYPFVFANSADGHTFTLCLDEEFAGFNQDNRGERLFDDEGKPTQYVQNVLQFTQGYQMEFQRTQAFCKKLSELHLLEPMQAQVTLASGENFSLTGFLGVNRDKLKALPGDSLADLAKTDELEWLYLHLQSLQNFEAVKDLLAKTSESVS
jgi:hypothetical protein